MPIIGIKTSCSTKPGNYVFDYRGFFNTRIAGKEYIIFYKIRPELSGINDRKVAATCPRICCRVRSLSFRLENEDGPEGRPTVPDLWHAYGIF
ncbi:MAG: hypothetical protein A3G93_12390 [Nitrospinae bacterium RIFCSPLOWO2_12_FULL_45_22]|nr:MAG: hypothetical protein A3G93_12390 [Nitrospinae bacterium RIFCSPLOWO2_12_FULL_45_22]